MSFAPFPILRYTILMTWASRRQAMYLLGIFLVLGLLIGIPAYFHFHKAPTCFDGVQNGMEEGIDCGGACQKICSFRSIAPIVRWTQEFQVVPGTYSVVALVENANDAYEADNVPYVIRLYDSRNVFIVERKGQMFLAPHMVIPVFETGLQTGERIPARAEFVFEKPIEWTQSTYTLPNVTIPSRRFDEASATPRLFVTLRNNTLSTYARIPVVAVLYDATENAIHASRTLVSRIPASSDTEIVFTWPEAFSTSVARIDIVPLFPADY